MHEHKKHKTAVMRLNRISVMGQINSATSSTAVRGSFGHSTVVQQYRLWLRGCRAGCNTKLVASTFRQRNERNYSRDGPQDEREKTSLPLACGNGHYPHDSGDMHEADVNGHGPVDGLVLPVVHHGLHGVLHQSNGVQRQRPPIQNDIGKVRRHRGHSKALTTPFLAVCSDLLRPVLTLLQRATPISLVRALDANWCVFVVRTQAKLRLGNRR